MKNIIKNAVIALLSGVTSYKLGTKEILWEGENGNPITIEYIGGPEEAAVVRGYWESGQKDWEQEYQRGQLHGKSIGWYDNGQKYWEEEYQHGLLHGKSIGWYKNGQKHWETEYQHGLPHGKDTVWYEDGQKHWEAEYQHGKLINEKYY